MIALKAPHMVLNAATAPKPHYQMWKSVEVAKDQKPEVILAGVATAAQGASGKKFKNLVINCHARAGRLDLGTGIGELESIHFGKVKGVVDNIYLVGCKVAAVVKHHAEYWDGITLCVKIAQAAGANVYASDNGQHIDPRSDGTVIPLGMIDDFEGKCWVFKADGTKSAWTGKAEPLPEPSLKQQIINLLQS